MNLEPVVTTSVYMALEYYNTESDNVLQHDEHNFFKGLTMLWVWTSHLPAAGEEYCLWKKLPHPLVENPPGKCFQNSS